MRYDDALCIAQTAIAVFCDRGWRFREGAARSIALAVAEQKGASNLVILDVLDRALLGQRVSINPKWDGSIG